MKIFKVWLGVFLTLACVTLSSAKKKALFERSSTFLVCQNSDPDCNTDLETVAETLWYFTDEEGSTFLVYTDSEQEALGLVNVTNPSMPVPMGIRPLGGEPTTVRVIGNYIVVGVNTSPDFVNPSGHLAVIDVMDIIDGPELDIDLGGQPDAVDVSKEGIDYPWYITVAIENERDEDLGDGAPPQMPAGELAIITIEDDATFADPSLWVVEKVDMTGLSNCLYPEDPEPEYVAIDPANMCVVVTLQENNCNVIVDLATGTVMHDYDAGSVDLTDIDLTEEGVIMQTESANKLREPDGATWIGDSGCFATANEGDLDGGSRGFSIFEASTGNLIYDSGNEMELEAVRVGHYPEERSGNKGNEPENVLYAEAKGEKFLFVCSERSGLVFVYDVEDPSAPVLTQTLAVGVGPEGLTFIPHLNVLAVASEKDDRGDKIRSSITLFELKKGKVPEYPTLVSAPRDSNGDDGPYIPFSALSGLASAAPFGMKGFKGNDNDCLFSIEDSFYAKSRFFEIDTSSFPAEVVKETRLMDSSGVLASCLASEVSEIDDFINDDSTVNLDPEGIAVSKYGGFWIVSEGKGSADDGSFVSPNLLLKVDDDGTITECILPDDSFMPQLKYGFEGVAEDGDNVVVAVQRAWGTEEEPRIAVYNTVTMEWKYAFYPLEMPASQNGGWVGLSDIAPVGPGKFYVIERDNQGSADAAIKMICSIDLGDYSFVDGTTLSKTLVKDLIPDILSSNGQVLEKIEGLAVNKKGKIFINNDNDGVDDNSGEQLLKVVGKVAKAPKGSKAPKAPKAPKKNKRK